MPYTGVHAWIQTWISDMDNTIRMREVRTGCNNGHVDQAEEPYLPV